MKTKTTLLAILMLFASIVKAQPDTLRSDSARVKKRWSWWYNPKKDGEHKRSAPLTLSQKRTQSFVLLGTVMTWATIGFIQHTSKVKQATVFISIK